MPGFDCLVSVLFPNPAAPVCAAARVPLGLRELWGSGEPLSSWCALLHLFVRLLKLNPIQLCGFEHLCLRHSQSRFFSMLSFVAVLCLSSLLFFHLY